MKKCPFCAEEIQDEAIKCKHCGEFLTGSKTTTHVASEQNYKQKSDLESLKRLDPEGLAKGKEELDYGALLGCGLIVLFISTLVGYLLFFTTFKGALTAGTIFTSIPIIYSVLRDFFPAFFRVLEKPLGGKNNKINRYK